MTEKTTTDEPSLYQRMKARGINMAWYERGKRGRTEDAIPLDDKKCSNLSIYLLKENGSLWTTTPDGRPYQQVRPPSKMLPRSVYICLCCKSQWDDAPISEDGVKQIYHPGLTPNDKEES